MTTIVSFLSKDYIIMGSDSLATYQRMARGRPVPAFHMNHVEKIFRIGADLSAFGVALTGKPNIGNQSVETLLNEFSKNSLEALLSSSWTIKTIANKLHQFLKERYEAEDEFDTLKLLLSGFEPSGPGEPYRPAVAKISVSDPGVFTIPRFGTRDQFGPRPSVVVNHDPDIYYAGQTREIEKLRRGMTDEFREELEDKIDELREEDVEVFNSHLTNQVERYRKRFFRSVGSVRPQKLDIESMPDRGFIYELADPSALDFDFANMSIQTAIDFVDFVINVQIKIDEFSKRPPTVGGDVQIALIQRQGFTWISKREWRHGENVVKRDD